MHPYDHLLSSNPWQISLINQSSLHHRALRRLPNHSYCSVEAASSNWLQMIGKLRIICHPCPGESRLACVLVLCFCRWKRRQRRQITAKMTSLLWSLSSERPYPQTSTAALRICEPQNTEAVSSATRILCF